MAFARCPVCSDILNLATALELDQPVTCSTCLSNLKIVAVEPLELEEASRRPPRPPRQNFAGQQGRRNDYSDRQGQRPQDNNRRPGDQGRAFVERAPYIPPLPPNPDKMVNGKRAQKWEKPKQAEDEAEIEPFDELENKLIRKEGGKGKRGK